MEPCRGQERQRLKMLGEGGQEEAQEAPEPLVEKALEQKQKENK